MGGRTAWTTTCSVTADKQGGALEASFSYQSGLLSATVQGKPTDNLEIKSRNVLIPLHFLKYSIIILKLTFLISHGPFLFLKN